MAVQYKHDLKDWHQVYMSVVKHCDTYKSPLSAVEIVAVIGEKVHVKITHNNVNCVCEQYRSEVEKELTSVIMMISVNQQYYQWLKGLF